MFTSSHFIPTHIHIHTISYPIFFLAWSLKSVYQQKNTALNSTLWCLQVACTTLGTMVLVPVFWSFYALWSAAFSENYYVMALGNLGFAKVVETARDCWTYNQKDGEILKGCQFIEDSKEVRMVL